MKVKDFIEILSHTPQYVHDSSDSEPNLFSVLDYDSLTYEKSSSIL